LRNPPYETFVQRQRKAKRYENIKNWSFIPKRKVQLKPREYDPFLNGLLRRNWMRLADLQSKFDPKVVYKFYANAWGEDQYPQERRA